MTTQQIHDEEFDQLVVDAVTIDEAALTQEFVRVSSDVAYFGSKLAQAKRNRAYAKLKAKQTRSAAFLALQEAGAASAGKGPTVATLEARVDLSADVLRADKALVEAEYAHDQAAAVCEGISSKRDMLISLGAHIRKEMDHAPVIRS